MTIASLYNKENRLAVELRHNPHITANAYRSLLINTLYNQFEYAHPRTQELSGHATYKSTRQKHICQYPNMRN